MCKKHPPEKQKLTTQYERDGKVGKVAKQVENMYMQGGVKPAYIAGFALEQYQRIACARDLRKLSRGNSRALESISEAAI